MGNISRLNIRVLVAGLLVFALMGGLPGAALPDKSAPLALDGSTSITGFQLPGFGADGYKEWEIQGRQAQAASTDPSQVDITDLKLLLYSGGPTLAHETTIESPRAAVFPRANLARGAGFIYITGASYSVTGNNWSWDGKELVIRVGRDVLVTFSAAATARSGAAAAPSQPITIHSDTLEIHQQPGRNQFLFTGNVTVTDGDSETHCRTLDVLAARNAMPSASAPVIKSIATPSILGAGHIEHILARGNVTTTQGGLEASGQQVEMFPGEKRLILSGSPQVRDAASDAILQGSRIIWQSDKQLVEVEPLAATADSPARVRVSLPPLASYQQDGAVRPPASSANGPRLVVTGEALRAHFGTDERRFDIERFVRIADPQLTLDAEHLDAEFNPPALAAAVSARATPEVGRLNHLLAKGNVVIYQSNRITHTQQAEISPDKGEILLSGVPRVEDSLSHAVITGNQIRLFTDESKAEVESAPGHPAELILPSLPGLGQVLNTRAETRVTSDLVTMVRGPETSVFTFNGHVHVTARDLETTCGSMAVLSKNTPLAAAAPNDPLAATGQLGEILSLVARNQVVIRQRDYKAEAARAEIYPQTQVKDESPVTSAKPQSHRMIQLYGDPAGIEGPVRPTVELPPMEDLGWELAPTNGSAPPPAAPATIISSDEQQLLSSTAGNSYWFKGNVKVDSGDFHAVCDEMEAKTTSVRGSMPAAIDKILADGHLRITQLTRVATAGLAEIYPAEGRMVLSQQPMVTDSADGYRAENLEIIELHRGERTVYLSGAPVTPGLPPKRPTIILPPMNFDNIGKPNNKASTAKPN